MATDPDRLTGSGPMQIYRLINEFIDTNVGLPPLPHTRAHESNPASAPFITSIPSLRLRIDMSEIDPITQAAQSIMQQDYMGAMAIFEDYVKANPDDLDMMGRVGSVRDTGEWKLRRQGQDRSMRAGRGLLQEGRSPR